MRSLYALLAVSLFTLGSGCGRGGWTAASEAAALEVLKPYNPSHIIGDNGHVTELTLDGTEVDDQALDQIRHFPQLRRLSLYGASITDEGLAKLKGSRYLAALGLGNTAVSDRGLKHLEKLPSLRWLWLTETKNITPQGVQQLKTKALPGLTVYGW